MHRALSGLLVAVAVAAEHNGRSVEFLTQQIVAATKENRATEEIVKLCRSRSELLEGTQMDEQATSLSSAMYALHRMRSELPEGCNEYIQERFVEGTTEVEQESPVVRLLTEIRRRLSNPGVTMTTPHLCATGVNPCAPWRVK